MNATDELPETLKTGGAAWVALRRVVMRTHTDRPVSAYHAAAMLDNFDSLTDACACALAPILFPDADG